MARKHESRFLISFMTIIQTGPVDSCWIICMMKLFDDKHIESILLMANVLAPDAWIFKKLEGLTRISDLFIATNQEQFVEYLSAVPLSLPDSFDPNLFHRWRQWGSWVAPGSRAHHCIGAHHYWCPPLLVPIIIGALHCIGAHHWCPPLVPTRAECTKLQSWSMARFRSTNWHRCTECTGHRNAPTTI